MSKKKIREYLEEKEVYHTGYDFLINLLTDQISLYNQARKVIKEEGVSVWGSAEEKFKVRNQHFKTLQECVQNITQLTSKLGLSVKDSVVIRELVGAPEETDGFDEM